MNEKIGVLLVRLACAEIGQDWTDAKEKERALWLLKYRNLRRLAKWWKGYWAAGGGRGLRS